MAIISSCSSPYYYPILSLKEEKYLLDILTVIFSAITKNLPNTDGKACVSERQRVVISFLR